MLYGFTLVPFVLGKSFVQKELVIFFYVFAAQWNSILRIPRYIIFYHFCEENDDFSVLETQKDIDLPVVVQGTICHFGKHVNSLSCSKIFAQYDATSLAK